MNYAFDSLDRHLRPTGELRQPYNHSSHLWLIFCWCPFNKRFRCPNPPALFLRHLSIDFLPMPINKCSYTIWHHSLGCSNKKALIRWLSLVQCHEYHECNQLASRLSKKSYIVFFFERKSRDRRENDVLHDEQLFDEEIPFIWKMRKKRNDDFVASIPKLCLVEQSNITFLIVLATLLGQIGQPVSLSLLL